MKSIFTILALSFAAITTSVFAADEEYPDISIKDLKKAIAEGTVLLIDVNGTKSYSKGHLPGAIDFRKNEDQLAAVLPKDKKMLIVAYCGGPSCTAYQAGIDELRKLGFTNVVHFSGGISGWIGAGEKIDDAKSKSDPEV